LHLKAFKKGQAEHIFSDLLPGALFILIGIFIINLTYSNVREETQNKLDAQIFDTYVERQLLQFLQTSLPFQGTPTEIFKLISDAKDRGGLRSAGELDADRGMFFGNYYLIEQHAYDIFGQLLGNDFWYLIVRYPSLPYEVEINYQAGFADTCIIRHEGHVSSKQLLLPLEEPIKIEMYYCVKP